MFYVAFLEPCLRGTLSRFFAYNIGRGDKAEASRVLATSAILLLPLMLIASALAFVFAPQVIESLRPDSQELGLDGTRALRILALGSCVAAVSGFASALLQSMRRFDLANVVGIPVLWIGLAVTLVVLKSGGGLAALALVSLVQSFVTLLINIVLSIRLIRESDVIDRRFLVPVWNPDFVRFVSNSAVARIGDLLRSNSTTLLVGWFVSLEAAALFAAIDSLRKIAFQGLVALVDTSAPRLAHSLEDEPALRTMLSSMLRMMGVISALVGVGVAIFGPDFLRIWLGEIVSSPQMPTIVFWMSAAMFMDGLRMVIQRSLRVRNRVGIIAIASILEGLVVLGLGSLLGEYYGLMGVVAARVFVSITYAAVVLPLLFAPLAGVSRREYWMRGMTRPLLVSIPPAMVCVLVLQVVKPESWGTFLLVLIPGGALLLVCTGSFGLDRGDKEAVRARLGFAPRPA